MGFLKEFYVGHLTNKSGVLTQAGSPISVNEEGTSGTDRRWARDLYLLTVRSEVDQSDAAECVVVL